MSELPQNSPPPGTPAREPLGYASGIHYEELKPADEVYREGELLVVLHGSTLPQRCLMCGAEGVMPSVRLVFTWDTSFQMTRGAGGGSKLELRKKVHMHAYLCAVHRQRWQSARQLGGVGAASSVLLMLAGMTVVGISENRAFPEYTQSGVILTVFGFACTILSLFYFTLRSRTVSCRQITEGYMYLEGASPEFLAGLPPAGREKGAAG